MTASEQFVVLLRHGIAEDKGGMKPDFDRRLTEAGNKRMQKIARALATFLPEVDAIISSPLVRCVETAEWVRKAYGHSITVETTEALIPGADPGEMKKLLSRIRARRIICVGHEPHLSMLMLQMTGMRSAGPLDLRKGGSYGIRYSAGKGQLEWMLPPKVLIDDQ